jgi:predicted dehydrogenase
LYTEEPVDKVGTMMQLDTQAGNKFIEIETPEPEPVNAIEMELTKFAEAIDKNIETPVTGEDGYKALKLAMWVLEEIDAHLKRASKHQQL